MRHVLEEFQKEGSAVSLWEIVFASSGEGTSFLAEARVTVALLRDRLSTRLSFLIPVEQGSAEGA